MSDSTVTKFQEILTFLTPTERSNFNGAAASLHSALGTDHLKKDVALLEQELKHKVVFIQAQTIYIIKRSSKRLKGLFFLVEFKKIKTTQVSLPQHYSCVVINSFLCGIDFMRLFTIKF